MQSTTLESAVLLVAIRSQCDSRERLWSLSNSLVHIAATGERSVTVKLTTVKIRFEEVYVWFRYPVTPGSVAA